MECAIPPTAKACGFPCTEFLWTEQCNFRITSKLLMHSYVLGPFVLSVTQPFKETWGFNDTLFEHLPKFHYYSSLLPLFLTILVLANPTLNLLSNRLLILVYEPTDYATNNKLYHNIISLVLMNYLPYINMLQRYIKSF